MNLKLIFLKNFSILKKILRKVVDILKSLPAIETLDNHQQ